MITYDMWETIPGTYEEKPVLEYYPAEDKKTDATVVIFPGGGYHFRAAHEGKGYAEFLNKLGMDAFVCEYRVHPYHFPLPLLDARRALRFVRANAEKFQINPNKVAVMGSSAGGHLAATTSTFFDPIEFENENDPIDQMDFIPNLTILAYPVICMSDLSIVHVGSVKNLLGGKLELATLMDPSKQVSEKTPNAFIWHTSDDKTVDVENSIRYVLAMHKANKNVEYHVFPNGRHGLGLAKEENIYVSRWAEMLHQWFIFNNWLNE